MLSKKGAGFGLPLFFVLTSCGFPRLICDAFSWVFRSVLLLSIASPFGCS